MIKLEGSSIDDINSDAAINLWFEKTERRPGSSKSAQNLQSIFYLELLFEKEIITVISDLIFIVLASVDVVASTSTMDTAENKEISGSVKDM